MNKSESQALLEAYKNIVEAGAHTEDGTYAMECIEKARNSLECIIGSLIGRVAEPFSIPYKSPYQPPYVTWCGTIALGVIHTWAVVKLGERKTTYDYAPAQCTHYKPRTLEDVLQSSGVSVAAIEDVAAEIRELLGVVG